MWQSFTKKIIYSVLIFFLLSNGTSNAQSLFDLLAPSSNKSDKTKVKVIGGNEDSENEILLIPIKGVIQEKNSEQKMLLEIQKDLIKSIKNNLKLAKKRSNIKAIILYIDSPGGEVTTSDIIYHLITEFKKKTGKPVITLFGSLGASGAYYIACAADKIIAHPTSIIGSIGVIIQSVNIQKLAKLIGIKAVTLKSEKTPKKDILSPFRELTASERKVLLDIVNDMYNRFVKIVAKSRNKSIKEITKIADGSIYCASKAKTLGLIDEIGYLEDAVTQACKLANIKDAALVKKSTKKSITEILSELAEMHSGAPTVLNYLKLLSEKSFVPSFKYQLNTQLK